MQNTDNYFSLVVRTSQDERSLIPALKATIHQVHPEIVPIGGVTMTDRINDSYSAYLHRSLAWLVGCFACAQVIAARRGRIVWGDRLFGGAAVAAEIGIRMALGAQAGSIYRLVLKEAGWLTTAGIGMGVAGSVAAAQADSESPIRRKLVGCGDAGVGGHGAGRGRVGGELRARAARGAGESRGIALRAE